MNSLPEQLDDLLRCAPQRTNGDSSDGATQARTAQLLIELETLRNSHAEAIAAAIEEREQHLQEQQEHSRRLQTIMMMAADGIITIDESGVVESFNQAAARIFGFAASEVLGKHVSQLMPPNHAQRHQGYIERYLAHRESCVVGQIREVTGRRKDGCLFPMEITISEVVLGERRIFCGIIRDITQRKRSEEELRRLHEQNEMILNTAGEGICGVDRQGRATFVNAAAARMLGWRRGDLIGRSFHEAVHRHEGGAPDACGVLRALASGQPSQRINDEFCRREGGSLPVEYLCMPIREGQSVAGAVITFQDITQRRKLESQLRQAQKLESIGQLAAGIAHEINTPTQYIGDNARFLTDAFTELMSVIDVCREFCARGAERPPADHETLATAAARLAARMQGVDLDYLCEEIPLALRQSLEGVERVARIVRSMKEFSHPGGDQMLAVDVHRAIESTLTVSRNEWKYVAEVETDFEPELPMVVCQAGDFSQVVLNLVINAAHAIADRLAVEQPAGEAAKGTIRIATRRQGDAVEIRVSDSGTGIPPAIRDKIFDPFFTTKEVGRGTGQGLAIVHSIITEKHHGTIQFETEMGRGTTFVVRLPLEQPTTNRDRHHA